MFHWHRGPTGGRHGTGFTLVELLVVMAVVAVLAAVAVPAGVWMLEGARVTRAVADLRQVETALEAYRLDHGGYPPVTVSCMASDGEEVLQLPRELADGGYLPGNAAKKTSTLLEDPFHRGHTYKYVAPDRYRMNGDLMEECWSVWVPEDFPSCESGAGRVETGTECPVAWAVWSVGPRTSEAQALGNRTPLDAAAWYARRGGSGIIVRYKERNGPSWSSWPRR